ncbi:hypothetical protein PO124_27580 [Bacillus licheniformis]|nr:hypothetical protein [Bacillus licheniformis]
MRHCADFQPACCFEDRCQGNARKALRFRSACKAALEERGFEAFLQTEMPVSGSCLLIGSREAVQITRTPGARY